ncbi:DUF3016 domain-containing protein [Colwellia sp. 1_MG-2023]|uniref:DUF3016 domain-containing protein n=1 Tax=Colwellia sp. 1_MG-2023 TaxID=3062649 RepID=UPI0026E1CC98|nr:DUF3016 domain-containing protein [Colwellia sp. 1_MG-2023]MDO6445154.1 DUF3016 domain-containing protein [Colwellia sp. 1_MG-2023]
MKNLSVILIAVSSLFLTFISSAATSEVTWSNPDKYRDVDAGNGHRAKFKAHVFANFEEHFTSLAQKLPEGQTLFIDVQDVDLAGDVHQNMRRIRVIKDIFFPRIKFSYKVVDSGKNELSSGDVNLKDMSFMMGSNLRYNQDSLGYEKRMLDGWFEKTFLQ